MPNIFHIALILAVGEFGISTNNKRHGSLSFFGKFFVVLRILLIVLTSCCVMAPPLAYMFQPINNLAIDESIFLWLSVACYLFIVAIGLSVALRISPQDEDKNVREADL